MTSERPAPSTSGYGLAERLLRPVAVLLHARAVNSPEVHPTDAPVARSGEHDALRVLVLGSGITSGWGVHTHGLALVGALHHELTERLQHPVDVEQLAAVGATLNRGQDLLGRRASEPWDGMVVAFGLSDVMRLTPPRAWSHALEALLAAIATDSPGGAAPPVLLVGAPPTRTLGLDTPAKALFDRHHLRLNRCTEAVAAARPRVAFAPLSDMAKSSSRPQGSPAAYRAWADEIADRLVPQLRAAAQDRRATAG